MIVKDILDYNRKIKIIIDNAKDVNALVKFKLLGMLKQFEPVIANFETVRNEKILKYGTTTEDGNIGIFEPKKDDYENDDDYNKAMDDYFDAIKKLNDDLNEVVESDIDIEITKFKYTDIMDAGIPSDYLLAIYDLIEE